MNHAMRTIQAIRFQLWMILLLPLLLCIVGFSTVAQADSASVANLYDAPGSVETIEGDILDTSAYEIISQRDDRITKYSLKNTSAEPIAVAEVVLHDWRHALPGSSQFYGEGFTMLSQTGGTLDKPADLGEYTDRGHYRLADPKGFRTVYGMATFSPPEQESLLLAFPSCRRFVGKFYVNAERVKVVINTEGAVLNPGESLELEEFFAATGDRNELLAELAEALNKVHPRLQHAELPTGWCSWYCFGPRVTSADILENLAVIKQKSPQLRFVQVDDGYQPWMGDWLETGKAFGGGIQGVLAKIRQEGFEPAIWVAPFIASPESTLFQEHPDWFVKDESGEPLRSDRRTFGGWRWGPWYMLDGTHPEAQDYLEHVFRTMRTEWGCSYYKLDANVWGAMPFGVRYDKRATSVEAYRQGMAAVRRGAGDSFLLGCNHAIWPSIGEVHGSRSSRDIQRNWRTISGAARENLMRN